MSLKFTDKNLKQPNCFLLSMHAYRILLPSETGDSRFNMLTDSVQPYSKPIIDLSCSVCTVKYQTSVWYFTVQTSRSVNKPVKHLDTQIVFINELFTFFQLSCYRNCIQFINCVVWPWWKRISSCDHLWWWFWAITLCFWRWDYILGYLRSLHWALYNSMHI